MAASVQVLCPNGRRQNVKITPNTKLLQVLEEVCKRQGFIPPEDYILMHGRNQVDLSLSIRFAGLSNNAKLEIVKSSVSRQEQDVVIALQLESGKRIQDSFAPSVTLWDILLHFEDKHSEYKGQLIKGAASQDTALQPVCIFMQEQVVGEPALMATNLKKLGLTSGKAIIRLLHRPVEDAVMADICEKVEKDKVKQSRLEAIAGKKQLEITQNSQTEIQQMSLDQVSSSESSDVTMASDHSSGPSQDASQKLTYGESPMIEGSSDYSGNKAPSQNVGESSQSQRIEESMEEDVPSASQQKLDAVAKSKASEPGAKRTISSEGAQTSSAINDLRDLKIPGVEIFTPDDFNNLTPQEQDIAQRLARRFFPHLQVANNSTAPSVEPPSQNRHQNSTSQPSFANFKFPEETKGKDLSVGESRSSADQSSKPCDRQPLVYNAMESLGPSGSSEEDELPEDFFELTQADVRKLYRDLQKSLEDMEEQPLLTKAMREIKTQAICDRYEKVVIRFHFPNKLMLQAFFRPRETVKSLHAFVRDCLQDKKLKFYLYTTPPRKLLDNLGSTLISNNLFPAALVYFGSEEVQDNYLEDDLLHQIVSRLEAETMVAKMRQPEMEKIGSDTGNASGLQAGPSGTQSSVGKSTRRPASSLSSSSSSTSSGGVPKWLKLGKK